MPYKVICNNCKDIKYYENCTDFSKSRCNVCNSNSFGLKTYTWENSQRPYPKHPIFFINCKECGERVASINVKCSGEPWKYVCDKCYKKKVG